MKPVCEIDNNSGRSNFGRVILWRITMLKKKYLKTKGQYEVTFEFNRDGAEKVALVCENNNWQPVEMKKAKSGAFSAKVRFPAGKQYQFRYLINNQTWDNDEAADSYIPNQHGSDNSVLSTVNGH